MIDSYGKERIEAYRYLIDHYGLPKDYLEKRRKDFETGNIFWYGVPADPKDGAKAIDDLSRRINAAIKKLASYKKISEIINDWDLINEAFSLEELSATMFTLSIPKSLGWQVDKRQKDNFAIFLGILWDKDDKKIRYFVAKNEGTENSVDKMIASRILLSPIQEFVPKSLPIAKVFCDWLLWKEQWIDQKKREGPCSYDEPLLNSENANGGNLTQRDVIKDIGPDQASQVGYNLNLEELNALVEELPPKMKEAFIRGRNDLPFVDRTQERACSRAVQWLKKTIEKRKLGHLRDILDHYQ